MAYFRSVIAAGAACAWGAYISSSRSNAPTSEILCLEAQGVERANRMKQVFRANLKQLQGAMPPGHADTVASLPVYSQLQSARTAVAESEKWGMLGGKGYHFHSIYASEFSEEKPTLVFLGMRDPNSGEPYFIFEGTLRNLQGEMARIEIQNGNYVRLPSVVPLKSSGKADVIITGNSDPSIGKIFKEKLLEDAARVAAGPVQSFFSGTARLGPQTVSADPNNPLLQQTPVRVAHKKAANTTLAQLVMQHDDQKFSAQDEMYRNRIVEGNFSVEPGKGAIGRIVIKPSPKPSTE